MLAFANLHIYAKFEASISNNKKVIDKRMFLGKIQDGRHTNWPRVMKFKLDQAQYLYFNVWKFHKASFILSSSKMRG